MQVWDAVETMGGRTGNSAYAISKALGKTPGFITNSKSRGSVPRVDTLANMARVCDYSLCLVPSVDVPTNAIEIDVSQA